MYWRRHLLSLGWLVAACGTATARDCPLTIDNPCFYDRAEGYVWFGRHWDGSTISVGQTVHLDCPTRIIGLELQFQKFVGLLEGDPIRIGIMSEDATVRYAEVVCPMPAFEDWASAYFEIGAACPQLEPGEYLVGATTDVPRHGGLAYCRIGDSYPYGERRVSGNGLAGPWSAAQDPLDLRFHLYLEAPPVAVETVDWGRLRALYR
jgi:hypothetical protein